MDVGVDEAGQQVGSLRVNDLHSLGMREAEDFASAHADVRFPDFSGQHVHQLRVGDEEVGGAAPARRHVHKVFQIVDVVHAGLRRMGNRGRGWAKKRGRCFPQRPRPLQSVFFEDGSRVKWYTFGKKRKKVKRVVRERGGGQVAAFRCRVPKAACLRKDRERFNRHKTFGKGAAGSTRANVGKEKPSSKKSPFPKNSSPLRMNPSSKGRSLLQKGSSLFCRPVTAQGAPWRSHPR